MSKWEEYFECVKHDHDKKLRYLKDEFLRKEVMLVDTHPSVSRGRAAIITDVQFIDGVPYFLCMVLRSGSETEFLNSESWTRQYRPYREFIVIP